MTYLSDWIGKTRKPHECRVCGDRIPVSAVVQMYRGVDPDEGFYSLWFHPGCWDYSRDWDDSDWDSLPPGSVSRKEIEAETK